MSEVGKSFMGVQDLLVALWKNERIWGVISYDCITRTQQYCSGNGHCLSQFLAGLILLNSGLELFKWWTSTGELLRLLVLLRVWWLCSASPNICLFYGDDHDVGMKRINTQVSNTEFSPFLVQLYARPHMRKSCVSFYQGHLISYRLYDCMWTVSMLSFCFRRDLISLSQECFWKQRLSYLRIIVLLYLMVAGFWQCVCYLLFFLNFLFFFCSFVNQTCFPFAATKWKM